jgi:RNA polymerase sigma factor (sigma-70 family)
VPAKPSLSDPEQWVELHGDYLFSYAMMRLHDASKTEDAVQETLLAALKRGRSFAGRSAEWSWLVGMIKNKIADYYRTASRETSFTHMEFYSGEESDRFVADGLFKDSWIRELGPQEWSSPAPGNDRLKVGGGTTQIDMDSQAGQQEESTDALGHSHYPGIEMGQRYVEA